MIYDILKKYGLMLAAVAIFSVVAGNILVDKVADKVIEKLEKPYSPSPYGPGLDPDKLDGYKSGDKNTTENLETKKLNWIDAWENSRQDLNQ